MLGANDSLGPHLNSCQSMRNHVSVSLYMCSQVEILRFFRKFVLVINGENAISYFNDVSHRSFTMVRYLDLLKLVPIAHAVG
jgi:hypothetical protein